MCIEGSPGPEPYGGPLVVDFFSVRFNSCEDVERRRLLPIPFEVWAAQVGVTVPIPQPTHRRLRLIDDLV